MYKRVETEKSVIMDNGALVEPVVTLADEHGGVSHWIEDDHCYVLVNMVAVRGVGMKSQRVGKAVEWIYAEAVEVLKELPALR